MQFKESHWHTHRSPDGPISADGRKKNNHLCLPIVLKIRKYYFLNPIGHRLPRMILILGVLLNVVSPVECLNRKFGVLIFQIFYYSIPPDLPETQNECRLGGPAWLLTALVLDRRKFLTQLSKLVVWRLKGFPKSLKVQHLRVLS